MPDLTRCCLDKFMSPSGKEQYIIQQKELLLANHTTSERYKPVFLF